MITTAPVTRRPFAEMSDDQFALLLDELRHDVSMTPDGWVRAWQYAVREQEIRAEQPVAATAA